MTDAHPSPTPSRPGPPALISRASEIVADWPVSGRGLINLLQAIQAECNYIPPEALPGAADRLSLPLSQVAHVATFYGSFSLEPRGRHLITCCLGTACHVRGAQRLIDELSALLEIRPGETTQDGEFTLETVRCLGACALAPVVMVDGEYHAKMTAKKARGVVRALQSGGARS